MRTRAVFNRRRGERGVTMLELVVCSGVMIVITLIVADRYGDSVRSELLVFNNGTKTNITSQMDRFVNKTFGVVSFLRFAPSSTLVKNDAVPAKYSPAGTWNVASIPYSDANVGKGNVDGIVAAQDSHLLESYMIEQSRTTGAVTKKSLNYLLSRCIDRQAPMPASTFAAISALPKPYWINGRVHCCSDLTDCPYPTTPLSDPPPGADQSDNTLRYWPTVFIYRGEGKVSTFPNEIERAVMPGAGFFVYFDRATNPSQAVLAKFLIINHCKVSKAGHGRRSPNYCAETKPIPSTSYEHFKTDLEIKIGSVEKRLTGGVDSSSAIDLGTGDPFETP